MSAWRIGLPLLAKELTERAARKRTYGARVMFAALLYVSCALFNSWIFTGAERYGSGNLGRGVHLLQTLMTLQFWGIYLFVPAMTSSLLTHEKERDSLGLLFLTKLGPWQILWQKYLGVLVPVFSLLLLTLPLAAVAYAYGGVTAVAFWSQCYVLATAAMQAAAIALMCSAFFRTSVGAFFATYCVGAAAFAFTPLLAMMLKFPAPISDWWRVFEYWSGVYPPFIGILSAANAGLGTALLDSVPAWLLTLACLGLARFWLVRRAFASGSRRGLRFFRWLDGKMQGLNARFGNRQFGRGGGQLPGAHPIAWREMKQKALAQPHYLVRLVLVSEVVTFGLILLFFNASDAQVERGYMGVLLAGMTALAVLAVSVQAANAFVSERISQTLDVLLTTPLSARQIVWEKARVMSRFVLVASVPLLTVILFEWAGRPSNPGFDYQRRQLDSSASYLACGVLSVAVHLSLVSWISLWVGLRSRTRFQAIIVSLSLLVAWCVVPMAIGVLAITQMEWAPESAYWIFAVSPLGMQALAEQSDIYRMYPPSAWMPIALHFSVYAVILLWLRSHCLQRADFYLRRQFGGRPA